MLAKKILLVFVYAFLITGLYAQNSHTLVTIDTDSFSIDEFDFIYNKNNNLSENPKSKKEYIDLFLNYKLKVKAAEEEGLDTLPSFLKEYNYYKNELTKPYLTDSNVTDSLKKEAYDHLKTEVKASHILIKLNPDANPEDTLKAFNKINDIRNKILSGKDFGQMAFQYSEDPSAKKNKGELGYFTGFMMVYPFESTAYNTPVGEVSRIIRTRFGYHIIKVEDKRPNPGEIRTAHIMKIIPPNSTPQQINNIKVKIDSIYNLLTNGANFEDLARKYSDDKNSARKGGELPWFGSNRMIPQFSNPAFELDTIGQISKVIKTPYGFHIIKLLDKRGIKPYKEMEDEITKKITRDERAHKGRDVVIDRIKKEDNYNQNDSTIQLLLSYAKQDRYTKDQFLTKFESNNNVLFTLKGEKYTIHDFLNDSKQNRNLHNPITANSIQNTLDQWTEETLIEVEKKDLSTKYPEYRYLLQEYYDGLLIFDISKEKIWDKASNDSIGIRNYYENHKENYFYPEQLIGKVIFAGDKKTLNQIKHIYKENNVINNDSLYTLFSKDKIKIIDGPIEKGEYKLVDESFWKDKSTKGLIFDNFPFVFVKGTEKAKRQKEFEDTKGQVISDFQQEIEEEWINELKLKHNILINKKALRYSKKD